MLDAEGSLLRSIRSVPSSSLPQNWPTPAPAPLFTHNEASLSNRIYVQVHSHGADLTRHVRVLLLLANVTNGIPALPTGYDQALRSGISIESSDWLTVGFRDLYNVRAEQPQVANFELFSDLLPTPISCRPISAISWLRLSTAMPIPSTPPTPPP